MIFGCSLIYGCLVQSLFAASLTLLVSLILAKPFRQQQYVPLRLSIEALLDEESHVASQLAVHVKQDAAQIPAAITCIPPPQDFAHYLYQPLAILCLVLDCLCQYQDPGTSSCLYLGFCTRHIDLSHVTSLSGRPDALGKASRLRRDDLREFGLLVSGCRVPASSRPQNDRLPPSVGTAGCLIGRLKLG